MSAKTISYNVPFADTRAYAKQGGLKDKVVVITGAGSGFGRDLAIELVGFGSKLVICDINSKGLEETFKEITKSGGEVVSQVVNVASWDQQLSLFEAGFKRFGKIDIVVANAGISEPTDNPNNPDIFPLKEQDVSIPPPQPSIRVIDINLTGVFYTMRLGFHYLRKGEKRSGRAIISVGSMASFTAVPTAPLYSATKAGVLGLVKSASDLSNGFLKDEGIRISMIAPFFALTNLIEAPLRKVLSDLPLASVEDVVGSMIHSMTPLDPKANPPILNGQVYTVPDSKGTFVIPSKVSQLVLYRELIERTGEIGRRSGQAIAKFSREMAERKTSKL